MKRTMAVLCIYFLHATSPVVTRRTRPANVLDKNDQEGDAAVTQVHASKEPSAEQEEIDTNVTKVRGHQIEGFESREVFTRAWHELKPRSPGFDIQQITGNGSSESPFTGDGK